MGQPTTLPAEAQTSPSNFSEQQILQTWGWIIAHEGKADHSEISDDEAPAFLKGVAEGWKRAPCPYYYGKIIPDVRILAKQRRAKYVTAVADRNQAEAKAFFDELDKDPDVVKLPSGLRYKIIRPGSGPSPTPQQTVNVHFLGHLLDGTEFAKPARSIWCSGQTALTNTFTRAFRRSTKGA